MTPKLATDDELVARVAECYEAGDTLGGGGVTPETAAEGIVLSARQTEDRLRDLANQGVLERDIGFENRNQRVGYRVADNDDDGRELRADGGQSVEGTEQTVEVCQNCGAQYDDFMDVIFNAPSTCGPFDQRAIKTATDRSEADSQ